MKFFFTLMFLTLAPKLFAGEINCQSAAGYYGNFTAKINSQTINVEAAQGFAYEIFQKLNISQKEYHSVQMSFPASACKRQGKALKCTASNITIRAKDFSNDPAFTFKANASISIQQRINAGTAFDEVTLTINNAKESHTFGDLFQQDRCKFTDHNRQ